MGLLDSFFKSPQDKWRELIPKEMEERAWFEEGNQEILDLAKRCQVSDLSLKGDCLVLGILPGNHLESLGNRFENVVALDRNKSWVAAARARFVDRSKFHFSVFLIQDAAAEIDRKFDFVFSFGFLDEIKTASEATQLFEMIYSKLSPGGTVIMRCRNRSDDSLEKTGYGIAFDREDLRRVDKMRMKQLDVVSIKPGVVCIRVQ